MQNKFRLPLMSLCVSFCSVLVACGGGENQNEISAQIPFQGLAGRNLVAESSAKSPLSSLVAITRKTSFGTSYCGGLLVTPTKVLTAFHCVDDVEASALTVFFPKKGKSLSTGTSFFSRGENRKVARVHTPSASKFLAALKIKEERDRNAGATYLDVAVLELSEGAPAGLTPFRVVSLASDEDLRTGTLSAFGWHTALVESSGGTYSDLNPRESRSLKPTDKYLLEKFFSSARVRHEDSVMRTLYGGSTRNFKFLASSVTNPVCEGDSGSPLFLRNAQGDYKLLGVTSTGLAINNRAVDPSLWGISECSAHTFYQSLPPLQSWLQTFLK